MTATATILPIGKLELGVNLLFYSPDEKRTQRLAARLRNLATVHWQDSRTFSPESWALQRSGHRLVLLDYATDTATSSTALAARLTELSPEVPLLGVGSTAADRATGVLAALRAGVRDFIDMDATDEEIRNALNRAMQQAGATPAAHRPGQLVLLLGTRPGIGTSTLAAHLGALAMPTNSADDATAAQALLLDLGQPVGDAALYLGVAGEFDYADALRNAGRIDPTLIRTALPHHGSRLAVLTQKAGSPVPAADVAEAGLLIERLLGIFDLLLCDLGGLSCRQIPPGLLQAAEQIWLVADQSIGSMVSLDTCLRELEQAQARDQRLALIINRHDDECGISARQIAERFELPLLARLPDRARALRASANQGLLLQQAAPRDPYIRALDPLLAKLRIRTRHAVQPSKWTQLLQRAGVTRWKSP